MTTLTPSQQKQLDSAKSSLLGLKSTVDAQVAARAQLNTATAAPTVGGSSFQQFSADLVNKPKSALKNYQSNTGGGGATSAFQQFSADLVSKPKSALSNYQKSVKNTSQKNTTTTAGTIAGVTGGQKQTTSDSSIVDSKSQKSSVSTATTTAPANGNGDLKIPKVGDVRGKNARGGIDKYTTKEVADWTALHANDLANKAGALSSKDATSADGIVASDASIIQQEKGAADTINNAAKVNIDTTYLDNQIVNLRNSLKDEMKSINEQYKVSQSKLEGKQSSETGQTSMQLANAGGYLGFSGSATGVLLNLAESHRSELQALDAQRQKAIFEAQDASQKNQYDVVRLKAQTLKDIEQETYNRQQDYLKKVEATNAAEAVKKEKMQSQNDIMTAIKSGSRKPEDIFTALGGNVDIKTINDFLGGISSGSGVFKFTPTQNASLLGSGLSMDDIGALNEYVSENGYNDTIKKTLTPSQRVAADKIFGLGGTGSGGGSAGGKFTDQEYRKLEQAGLTGSSRQEQLDFLYGKNSSTNFKSPYTSQVMDGSVTIDSLPPDVQDEVTKELYAQGYASDSVPTWYQDAMNAASQQTLNANTLQEGWKKDRQVALGTYVDPTTDSAPWYTKLFGNN